MKRYVADCTREFGIQISGHMVYRTAVWWWMRWFCYKCYQWHVTAMVDTCFSVRSDYPVKPNKKIRRVHHTP